MAEHVQAALDRMVAPLQDLMERGIFSQAEVHAIVNRRRDFEYRLRRRVARQADFLQYIQEEMQLEQLRQLRVKMLKRKEKEQQREQQKLRGNGHEDDEMDHEQEQQEKQADLMKKKHRMGDKHIGQLIHLLWTRTLRKYRSNVQLHLQYAAYCQKLGAHDRLSRVYAEALQIHPKEPALWIQAASHAFFGMGSVQKARVLLQRGIRTIQNLTLQQDLWVQSFALELHFVQKMKGRRALLLGERSAPDENGNEEHDTVANKIGDDGEETEPSSDRHALARLVYDHAIAAIPDAVAFRLQFLDQCHLFPHTDDLQRHILETMERDFRNNVDAWMARIHYYHDNSRQGANLAPQDDDDAYPALHDDGICPVPTDGDDDDDSDDDEDKKDDEEEDFDEAANNSDLDAPPAKRRKPETEREAGPKPKLRGDLVLQTIRDATNALKNHEMYHEATGFLQGYIDELPGGQPLAEEASQLLDQLFLEASQSDFLETPIALAYADFLMSRNLSSKAADILEKLVGGSKTRLDGRIWGQWAKIAALKSHRKADQILQRGCETIPIERDDHMFLLLQMIGVVVSQEVGVNKDKLLETFERIVLLSPGFLKLEPIQDAPFGVSSMVDAFLQCLRWAQSLGDMASFRRIYDKVLFRSTVGNSLVQLEPALMKDFVDLAIEVEKISQAPGGAKRIKKIFDSIPELFRGTVLASEYRDRKHEELLSRVPSNSEILEVPTFNASSRGFNAKRFAKAFDDFQVVHLRNVPHSTCEFRWTLLQSLFATLNEKDKASWCVERNSTSPLSPNDFLSPKQASQIRAYCSFLVQNDAKAYEKLLDDLPLKHLAWTGWSYEKALWFFFGRNPPGRGDLDGRPEHTDSISHDGTWHYQLSGTKLWFIQPTSELMHSLRGNPRYSNESKTYRIECKQGDVLVINTRLWFHRTVIPEQHVPSVSYARDFHTKKVKEAASSGQSGWMTNLDGLYATEAIDAGTILFTEDDMPDCELHRTSNDPNCEVVQLENGIQAVVSRRPIAAGEFFCVDDSESEPDDGTCE